MSDEAELLSILNAHGQNFLSSFSPHSLHSSKKRKRAANSDVSGISNKTRRVSEEEVDDSGSDELGDENEDEWHGFGSNGNASSAEIDEDTEDDDEGPVEHIEDDGFTASSSNPRRAPAVVVFSGSQPIASSSNVTNGRAFMSSRVSKVREEVESKTRKTKDSGDDLEEDRNNARDDALLHRLVHTQLLSGVANPDLNLTPAQRKKALAGRIQELTGNAKLGKGEKAVRAKERNRAAKHIRDGMAEKQVERRARQLTEAKDTGNYHPAIKKLFDDSSEPAPSKKREKGLRMGVGKFSGGILKLSKSEIQSVNGPPGGFGRGRGSGRGRGRGRGGKSRP